MKSFKDFFVDAKSDATTFSFDPDLGESAILAETFSSAVPKPPRWRFL
jgi:hypothetical protein